MNFDCNGHNKFAHHHKSSSVTGGPVWSIKGLVSKVPSMALKAPICEADNKLDRCDLTMESECRTNVEPNESLFDFTCNPKP